jgi:hypothetical protein
MIEDAELTRAIEALVERFPTRHGDWADVLRRADVGRRPQPSPIDVPPDWRRATPSAEKTNQRPRTRRGLHRRGGNLSRRQVKVIVVVALSALLLAGAALAVDQAGEFNFFAAKHAPSWSFVAFARAERASPRLVGQNFTSLTAAPRVITDVRDNGKDHILVVAPTKGGYCYSWRGAYLGGRCLSRASVRSGIDVVVPGDGSGPIAIYGSFAEQHGVKLQITYQDGRVADVPAFWVSPPVASGFFLYWLTPSQRKTGHRPVSLALFSASGRQLAKVGLPV